MNISKLKQLLLALAIFPVLFSCKDDDAATVAVSEELKIDVVSNYSNIVYNTYLDSHTTAVELQTAITAFTATPTAEGLTDVQNLWLAARSPYGKTETFRFYDGPIDDANGPEGQLNAWPMDESYIDYIVSGDANTEVAGGIINKTTDYPELTKEIILGRNLQTSDESDVTAGYHAIEFLLWGQDLSLESAGQRAYTDYLTAEGSTNLNGDRRALYLNIVTEILVEDLAFLVDQWGEAGAYRTTFEAMDQIEAITKIITGVATLARGELAAERIAPGIDSEDQEDEHSCFSDNTHNDILENINGMFNVYKGAYTTVSGNKISGSSISEVTQKLDSTLANKIDASFTKLNVLAKSEIINPIDVAITTDDGTAKLEEIVAELRILSDLLVNLGPLLDVKISN